MEKLSDATITDYITNNQNKMYRLAFSYVHNPDMAMDIVQNAIIRILEKYHKIRQPEFLSTWVYRVVVNESLSMLRKEKRVCLSYEDVPEESYQEKEYERLDYDLYDKIDRLPPKMKTVVILRYYEDLPLQDIATITGTSLSTVKTRLYTALKKLKLSMEDDN